MQILWNNFLGLGEAIASLLLLIDSVIYWLISELYGLYVILAQAKIFKDELYVDIANKVYLIMGVVALFIVAYILLQSIINPDNIKKAGVDFVKKFVIAIVMIILTPSIFNFLFVVQDAIFSDNIIENIFLGNDYTYDAPVYVTYLYDADNPNLTGEEILEMVADENNTEYSASNFVLDEKGEATDRFLIRYEVEPECTETEYKKQIANCEKIILDDASNNELIKEYGNEMVLAVLQAFLHPNYESGLTDDTTIVNASNASGTGGKSAATMIGCFLGGAASIVIVGVGGAASPVTFGGSALAAAGLSTAIIAGSCAAGFGVAGEIYEVVNYKEYSWTMAKEEMSKLGKFNVITAFAGDGSTGNMGIIGGEMSYTPIVSTICGLVLLYLIFSFCLDLGLRAAKLTFYQMLAPITFLLNILPDKKNLLNNWFKAVLTTWGEVFIRIFTMFAVVYLFSNLDMLKIEENYGFVAKAIIVMGLILFVKQFPKLLGDVTGIKSENMKIGIMSKLGAGGALAVGALVGGALTAGARNATNSLKKNKGQDFRTKVFNTARSGVAGFVSGGLRSAKSAGFKAKNWGDMKNAATKGAKTANIKSKERALYKAMHGGTVKGAVAGRVSDALTGAKFWAGLSSDILDIVSYEDEYINLFDDYAAIYSNATYKATESHLSQISARILAEGENALVSPGSGSTKTLKQARDDLKEELTLMRLQAIRKSRESAAYVAYNIARQVIKDPALAERAGVSSDFIEHANDFVLRDNKIWHSNGREWTEEELQKLFESSVIVDRVLEGGKKEPAGISVEYLYSDKFKGLNATKGAVKGKRTEDKNSIAYKEAKKAKDSKKS